MLEAVKKRLKIYYYDEEKDAEIQSYIDEAVSYLKHAGAQDFYFENDSPLAIGAVALYVKMAMESDAKNMVHNPVLLSMISQMKYTPEAE